MPFSSRSYVNRYSPSNRFPIGLKWLLITNIGIFVLDYLLRAGRIDLFQNFKLVPAQVVQTFAVWQLVTYMFVHSHDLGHILWNMLGLWMFGAEIERLWGTQKFLRYYFICGISAGVLVVITAYIVGAPDVATVGSSGAIFGLLMAYAILFPDRTILFGFLIPMKSKYFVMIIGAIVFLNAYMATVGGQQGSGIAVTAQLGGMVAGFLWLRGRKLHWQVRAPLVSGYKDWKLRRAKKKFEVYLKKQDS